MPLGIVLYSYIIYIYIYIYIYTVFTLRLNSKSRPVTESSRFFPRPSGADHGSSGAESWLSGAFQNAVLDPMKSTEPQLQEPQNANLQVREEPCCLGVVGAILSSF